ncbi:hypothetical protein RI367_003705 [Sorochytrium milnesiophthora]
MTPQDILAKPQSIAPEKLWKFLGKLSLSRKVEPSSLADGVLVAEIIHTYAPLLVTASDLQRLNWELQNDATGRSVWLALCRTPLKQLCIQLSEEILTGALAGQKESLQEFLGVLMQQASPILLFASSKRQNFTTVPRVCFLENFQSLTMLRTFRGTPVVVPEAPLSTKTLIRLSNVDYQTKKIDVQRFLYPIVAHQSDIHIPIHLGTGKMTYTIYVEFDDSMLPLKAVDLHSGHTLLSRRVEITVVAMDELYHTLYGRTLSGAALSSSAAAVLSMTGSALSGTPLTAGVPTPTGSTHNAGDYFSSPVAPHGEFLSDDTKERIAKLCRTVKNSFNGKTPERPFEHVISFLRLLPWSESVLTLAEVERAYELLWTAVGTLITYLQADPHKQKFSDELLERLVAFAKTLPFEEQQHTALQAMQKSYLLDPSAPVPGFPISSQSDKTPSPAVEAPAKPASLTGVTPSFAAVAAATASAAAAGNSASMRREPLRQDLLTRRLKQGGGAAGAAPMALSINIPSASVVFPAPASAPLKHNGSRSVGTAISSVPVLERGVSQTKGFEPLHSAPLYGSFDFSSWRNTFASSPTAFQSIAAAACDMPSRYPSPAASLRSQTPGSVPSMLSLASILSADNIFSPITPITPEIYAQQTEEIDDAPEAVLGRGLWAAM